MSDHATLSSFEESFSQINANATTNTTPPLGEFNNRKQTTSGSILSANTVNVSDPDFDSLPNVLNSLNLNDNKMFTSPYQVRSSTPPNDWKLMNSSWNVPNIQSIQHGGGVQPIVPNEHQIHHHESSNSVSSKDESTDFHLNTSFSNQNQIAPESQNNSFFLPDQSQIHGNDNNNNNNSQLDSSFVFENSKSIGNSPSSDRPKDQNQNQNQNQFTPVLGESSRTLNYNVVSPNHQSSDSDIKSSSLTSELLKSSGPEQTLGMGVVTPMINHHDSNLLNVGGFIPNQFSFLQANTRNSPTPPLNGLPSNLMNHGSSALNLLPNHLGLGMNPAFPSNDMTSMHMLAPMPGFPNNAITSGYGYNFNNSLNAIYGNNNGNFPVDGTSNHQSQKFNGGNNMNSNNNNNNSTSNNRNYHGQATGNGKMNHNNNSNGNSNSGPRNNLGLSSTANVHRKHSSNHKRGEDASRFVNATLDDFINEIFYLCKDQHGCRFLQRQLEIDGEDAATKIFNEIQLNVIELMIDPFGNYLIQKLLERVNESQRTTLVKNASSQFVRIALDPHGTRALQKLVECISTETEFQIIINSLSSYVVLLSRDLNGNHVIQKCLQKLPPDHCEFIFQAACDNCVKIAKHRHGCCVLQRCFDHGTPVQCESLALKVGENSVELCIDPYGNYVVQYVLSMEENRLRIQNDPASSSKIPDTSTSINFIINSLAGHLTKLSTHKFGSNVIEKSLRIPTLAPVLIKELLNDSEGLKMLLHDAYGNYVLQTSLDVADDTSFKELSEMLKPFLNDVRNTPHGRRILSKLISRGGNSSIYSSGNNSNGSGNDFGFDNQPFQQNSNKQHNNHNGENHSHNRRQGHSYGNNNHYGIGGNGNGYYSNNNNNNNGYNGYNNNNNNNNKNTNQDNGYNKNKLKYGY